MSLINDMLKELESRRAMSEPLAYASAQGSSLDANQAAVLAGLSGVDNYRRGSLSAVSWRVGPVALVAIVVVSLTMSERVNQVGLRTSMMPDTPWTLRSGTSPSPAAVLSSVAATSPAPVTPAPADQSRSPSLAELSQTSSRQVAADAQLLADARRYSLALSSNLTAQKFAPGNATSVAGRNDVGIELPADLRQEVGIINQELNVALPAFSGRTTATLDETAPRRGMTAAAPAPEAQPGPLLAGRGAGGVVVVTEGSTEGRGHDHSSAELSKRELGSQQHIAADGLFRRAVALVSKGNFAKAGVLLEQAVAEDPTHEQARESLAGIMVKRGEYELALQTVKAGLEEVPGSARLMFVQVRLLVELERYDQALRGLNEMPRGTIHEPSRLAYSGAVLLRMGRVADAAEVYKRAVMAAPDEGRWWLGLGVALEASDATQQAAAAFERASLNRDLGAEARRYAASRAAALQARR